MAGQPKMPQREVQQLWSRVLVAPQETFLQVARDVSRHLWPLFGVSVGLDPAVVLHHINTTVLWGLLLSNLV